jgi:hypothetical protein
MPKVTVSIEDWTVVATTTADTVFQNQNGINPMYLTTENPTSLPLTEGFYLPPTAGVVIGGGQTVYAVTFRNSGDIFYMEV